MPSIGSFPYATFVSGNPKIDKSRGIQFDSLNPNKSLKARARARRRSKERRKRNSEQESLRKYQSPLRSPSPNARKGNGTSPQIIQSSQWQKWEHTGSISCVSPQRNPHLRPQLSTTSSINSSKSVSSQTRPRTVPAPGPQPFGNVPFNPNLQPCQINPKLGPQLFVEPDNSRRTNSSPGTSPRLDDSRPATPSLSLGAPPAPFPPQPRVDLVIPTASISNSDLPFKKQRDAQMSGVSSMTSQDLAVMKQDITQQAAIVSLPVLSPMATKSVSSQSPLYRMEEGRRRHSSEAQHRLNQNDARAQRWKNMRTKSSPKANRHGMITSPDSITSIYAFKGETYEGFTEGAFELRKTEASAATAVPGDEIDGGTPTEQLMSQARKPIKHYTSHLDPRPSLRVTMKPGTSTYLTLARK